MNTPGHHKKILRVLIAGSAVSIGAIAGFAESVDSQIEALRQKVSILERQYEIEKEASEAKAKETSKVTAGKDGFSFKSPDSDFQFKLRGLIQADSRFFLDDSTRIRPDQFLLRRIRPTFEGTAYKIFDFRITPDFANNSSTSLFDAYIDVKPWDFLKLRVGKFKPPVGLERLQSASDLFFVERGFPTGLVPSRDTGIQLFGDVLNGRLSWATSFADGAADNGVLEGDTDDAKEAAARIFLHPFKDSDTDVLRGLGVGFASTYSGNAVSTPTVRTPGQFTAFTYSGGFSNGERIRLVPQGYLYWRSFGLLGEYVRSSQVAQRVTTGAKTRVTNEAWQIAGSWVLTGEDASYKGVKPRTVFDVKERTWGAFELTGRYQVLRIDPDLFSKGLASATASVQNAKAVAVGLNWYLNRAVKFVVNYEQTTFDRGAAIGDRPNEKVFFTRWQFAY